MSDVTPPEDDGRVNLSERVDDLVEEWHTTPMGVPLHEHLDMSHDEYARWVESGVFPVGYEGRLL